MGIHKVDTIVNSAGTGALTATKGLVNPIAPVLLAYAGGTLGNASISSGALADVAFKTVLSNTHPLAYQSFSTFTVPAGCGGLYMLTANLTVVPSSSGGGTFFMEIHVNGSVAGNGSSVAVPVTGQKYNAQVVLVGISLSAGDTVVLQANQNTGASVDAYGTFGVQRILSTT